jgi:pyruvate/2-oxoacid:ferredoxin oxidoreductase alpha subunit
MHWSAGARLPIVMANVNRAIAPPWNLWAEQTDSLAQRDTSWLHFYCEDNQEVLDTAIQAFKIAEAINLPVMYVLDAFILSHTAEIVDIPDQKDVDEFLPPFIPRLKLDPDDPHAFGSITEPAEYQKLKQHRHEDMVASIGLIKEIDAEYRERFGRGYGTVLPYRCEDAELILVTSGTVSGTARVAIDELRAAGVAAGALKIRLFRPFPGDDVAAAIGDCPKVAVIDRNLSVGASGIFAQELKAALYGRDLRPTVLGFVGGLGGGDFTPAAIGKIARRALECPDTGQPVLWEEL